jgi:hypothetical protein
LVAGPSINKHHLIPKTFGGIDAVWIHVICHTKIHSVFTERELFNRFHTFERLVEHPEMEKFVKWVRKRHPEYRDKNRATRDKRGRPRSR